MYGLPLISREDRIGNILSLMQHNIRWTMLI